MKFYKMSSYYTKKTADRNFNAKNFSLWPTEKNVYFSQVYFQSFPQIVLKKRALCL